MKLIGLMGKARSGKDTVADYLQGEHSFGRYAFADPMKDMLEAAFGDKFRNGDRERPIAWLGKSPRQLMQSLGTEWGRDEVHPDLWVLIANEAWQVSKARGESLVVSDVRFANEAQWIVDQGGVLIEIVRDNAEPVNAHLSENVDLDQFPRYVVDNNLTFASLYHQVELLLERIYA